jgi:hypothetical protein
MSCFGIAPKQILFLYRFYRDALQYYENKHYNKIDYRDHERQICYYMKYKKILDMVRDNKFIATKLAVINSLVLD